MSAQAAAPAAHQAQPLTRAESLAFVHQHLEPEADADQQAPAGRHVAQRSDEIAAAQILHGVAEGADTRQNHDIGALDRAANFGHRRSQADGEAGLLDTEEIAHAEIVDGDPRGSPVRPSLSSRADIDASFGKDLFQSPNRDRLAA